MGGKFGVFQNSVGRIGPLDLNVREYAMLKKLWLEVETNPRKYGRGVCMRLFTQFPQYVKYFSETSSPLQDEFHRIDNTFVTMLSTIGFLILDFYKNPKKFDNALDYVAMIHQEMYIKLEDFDNFTHALIQYLKDTMPEVMTEECAKVFADFMDDLIHQLLTKMVKSRAEFSRRLDEQHCVYNPCRWLNPRGRMIFGHEQSYWITRRNRWEAKMKRWKSGEAPSKPNVLFDLLNESPIAANDHRSNSSSPVNEDRQPHAEGSVMSEILQDKLRRETKDQVFYRSGTLRSGSSQQNLNMIGRYSAAAAIILGNTEVSRKFPSQLTPRERFRNRNRATDLPLQSDENVGTMIEARKKRRESHKPDDEG